MIQIQCLQAKTFYDTILYKFNLIQRHVCPLERISRLFKNEISKDFGEQFWPAWMRTQIWESGSADPIESGSGTLKKA
jgi:hypothetical protein